MRRRLVAGLIAVALAGAGCGGLSGSVPPGASMDKLCDATRDLAAAVRLARESTAASRAGDGVSAADRATQADTRRQNGQAASSWAADLESHQGTPTPGFAERMAEFERAQHAVDLAVGVLGAPAAPAAVEARPRLLDAAEASVRSIGLPEACSAIETPSASR
jgi:hypothetical protein